MHAIWRAISNIAPRQSAARGTISQLSRHGYNTTLLGQLQQTLKDRGLQQPVALTTNEQPAAKYAETVLACPPFGVECSGSIVRYAGNVWHNPAVAYPNCSTVNGTTRCTNIYACVFRLPWGLPLHPQ